MVVEAPAEQAIGQAVLKARELAHLLYGDGPLEINPSQLRQYFVAGDLKFGPNEGSSSRLDSRIACGSSFVQTRARALVLTPALCAGQVWFTRGVALSS